MAAAEAVGARAAEERPFVAPDAGPVSPDLASVREKWGVIREGARRRHHRAGALLNSRSYVKSFEGDLIEIGFGSQTLTDMVKSLDGGAVLVAIREAVIEAVGRPVDVLPVLWDELNQAVGTPAAAQARPSHLVDEALKQGAELVAE